MRDEQHAARYELECSLCLEAALRSHDAATLAQFRCEYQPVR